MIAAKTLNLNIYIIGLKLHVARGDRFLLHVLFWEVRLLGGLHWVKKKKKLNNSQGWSEKEVEVAGFPVGSPTRGRIVTVPASSTGRKTRGELAIVLFSFNLTQ